MANVENPGWVVPMTCGLHDGDRDRRVSQGQLQKANEIQLDMLTTPITNNHFKERVTGVLRDAASKQDLKSMDPVQMQDIDIVSITALDLSDTSLEPDDFVPQLLGVTSNWVDLCSPDPLISGVSRQVLNLEVQYAAFCGVDHVIIPGPRLYYGDAVAADLPRFARAVQEAMELASHTSFYIKMPMFDHPSVSDRAPDGLRTREEYLDKVDVLIPDELDLLARWDAWHLIRSACKYSGRLFLALSIPMHIPDPLLQARWFSEPIRIAILEKSAFMEDAKGRMGLSRPCSDFVGRILRMKVAPWILFWDTDTIRRVIKETPSEDHSQGTMDLDGPTPAEAAKVSDSKASLTNTPLTLRCRAFFNFLQYDQPITSDVERYGTGYQDYLQIPLQPLADNLESMTYEVFEKDPVKYDLYERAIAHALRDWREKGKPTSGPDGKVVVTVAGAGRGPLVTRAMRASETEGVPIDLWAVEKNPNAFVLLQKHNRNPEKWNEQVHLAQSDMRSWDGPRHPVTQASTTIDILITELLGSFADNELSPECLDGILHRLSPQGISIPQSYTPFLTPVAAPKIHADIAQRATWEDTAPETPAVVWLHAIDYLSCENYNPNSKTFRSPSSSVSLPPIAGRPNVWPVWTFNHGPQDEVPIKTTNKHNERYARLTFRCKNRGVCHGLAGYFESVLYPGVELSTNPNTIDEKSKDMISWFPIYFPLKTPILLPDNASLTCTIWRQTDGRKVWYEWMVESWMLTPNHQKIRLGQSEVHSSAKNGCLM